MRNPCCEKKETNKGSWSKQEDQKLIDYIQKHGEGSWRSLPQAAGLRRCGKSCRLRWLNYLRPDLKRGNFGEDEEDLIIRLHALLGNRWSLIAGRLPGRTDNEVKNYWNSHIRKKLLRKGAKENHPQKGHQYPNIFPRFTCSPMGDNGKSFGSKDDKTSNHEDLNDSQILDSTSGHDQYNNHGSMPDLNLDLTLSITYSSKREALQD